MSTFAIALLASTLAATSPGAVPVQPSSSREAQLRYVAPLQSLAIISHGMTAVDGQPLILGQRSNARVASGTRTIWYSCPNESQMIGGSRLSFDFKAGQAYELVCRAGQQAQIRAAENC